MLDYWVYENWTVGKAIVHKAACRFCNDGRGIETAGLSGQNGQWHRPFNERDLAFRAAAQLNCEQTRGCEKCC